MLNLEHRLTSSTSTPKFKRYVGYNNKAEFESLVKRMYINARQNGVFFNNMIMSPDNTEISRLSSVVDINNINLDTAHLTQDLTKLHDMGLINIQNISRTSDIAQLAERFSRVLGLLGQVIGSQSTIRNSYIKFLGWFMRYRNDKLYNILYFGNISKYEVYWFYLLNVLGSEINLVCPLGDESYLKIDPQSQLSQLVRGSITLPFNMDFSKIDYKSIQRTNEMYDSFTPALKQKVQQLTTSLDSFSDNILEAYHSRLTSRGCEVGADTIIPVYFAGYIGFAELETYNNVLFTLRDKLGKSNKLLLYIEKGMQPPQPNETGIFLDIDKSLPNLELTEALALTINIKQDPARTALARMNFIEMMKDFQTDNSNVFFNFCVKIITWLHRSTSSQAYIDNSKNEIPVVIYFGGITPPEMVFLHLLSRIGLDVLYVSIDKSFVNVVNSYNHKNRMQVFEMPHSQPNTKFPDKLIKTKVATVAYNAERELDTILYNDSNIFRSRQFSNSRSLTLKTTYDEINILWHQQAKYRSGFETSTNLVSIPNMFAKISGVPNGDLTAYWEDIRYKLSPDSIISVKSPTERRHNPQGEPNLSHFRQFLKGNEILIDKLKASQFNRYSYLNDNVQYLIFYKMQEAIDSGFIKLPPQELPLQVIYVGLNFNKDILKLIQNFDFTKDIPKLIIVDCIEDTFTKVECVQLILFNLLGFDVILYTPTGYKNLETFVSNKAYEEYVMEEFKYDIIPPKFRKPDEIPTANNSGGLFNKFFRKGRK